LVEKLKQHSKVKSPPNADNSTKKISPLESLIKSYNLNTNYFSKIGGRRPQKI
jgi:hypothetical protein